MLLWHRKHAASNEDGYLYLADRKKSIIVTAGGKSVAPAPIEGAVRKSPYIEEICLVRDKQKFVSALIEPDFASLTARFREIGRTFNVHYEVVSNRDVYGFLWSEVEQHQSEFARYEQVKKITVLPEPFTIKRGELTPALRVKRDVVERRYDQEIRRMYQP